MLCLLNWSCFSGHSRLSTEAGEPSRMPASVEFSKKLVVCLSVWTWACSGSLSDDSGFHFHQAAFKLTYIFPFHKSSGQLSQLSWPFIAIKHMIDRRFIILYSGRSHLSCCYVACFENQLLYLCTNPWADFQVLYLDPLAQYPGSNLCSWEEL